MFILAGRDAERGEIIAELAQLLMIFQAFLHQVTTFIGSKTGDVLDEFGFIELYATRSTVSIAVMAPFLATTAAFAGGGFDKNVAAGQA